MVVTKIERQPNAGAVDALMELLEEAKAGNLQDFVCVGNLVDEGNFIRSSVFQDRWRLLGAIEYAKSTVEKAD